LFSSFVLQRAPLYLVSLFSPRPLPLFFPVPAFFLFCSTPLLKIDLTFLPTHLKEGGIVLFNLLLIFLSPPSPASLRFFSRLFRRLWEFHPFSAQSERSHSSPPPKTLSRLTPPRFAGRDGKDARFAKHSQTLFSPRALSGQSSFFFKRYSLLPLFPATLSFFFRSVRLPLFSRISKASPPSPGAPFFPAGTHNSP